MVLGTMFITNLTFAELFFAITLAWLLVVIWQRCVDNFTFRTLKLDKKSTWQTFIIALVATGIFLAFVFCFNSILGPVETDLGGSPFTDANREIV